VSQAVSDADAARGSVRIVVIDDHPVVREGVITLLDRHPSMTVVGYAPTGAEGAALAAQLRPDVILLDLRLPDMLAPEVVTQVKRDVPETKIVVFTAFADHAALESVVRAGADGCLLKDVRPADFVDVVGRVAKGEQCFDPRLDTARDRRTRGSVDLTPREYDVLRRVAMGESNPEIAEVLALSRNTVKAYLQSVMQKLGARNRIEAISRANEEGLL
jgi:two-component system nitrate/nitrite response regulator NarL